MRTVFLKIFFLFISLLLAACITLQGTGKGGMLLSYLLNKSYITQEFCENRDNKKLHCNGKCYLVKQIKQQEEQQKSPQVPGSHTQQEEIILDIPVMSHYSLHPVSCISTTHGKGYHNGYLSQEHGDIFHPPA